MRSWPRPVKRWPQLEEVIAAAWRQIDSQIKEERGDEDRDIADTIPPELIALYEQLRKSKEGVASRPADRRSLRRMSSGACRYPKQAEAADWDPPRCLHCMRILVL